MKKIVLASVFAVLSTSAIADPNTGCGIGSLAFPNQDSVLKQLLAGTTNNFLGNQTFGISSGTFGCRAPDSIVSNEQIHMFVAGNMDALATDIANGYGEVVDTLAALLNVGDKAKFIQTLQANFDVIYTSEGITSAMVIDHIVAVAG